MPTESVRILVVEDEVSLADTVRYNLEREGDLVSLATDGRRAPGRVGAAAPRPAPGPGGGARGRDLGRSGRDGRGPPRGRLRGRARADAAEGVRAPGGVP